LSDGTEPPYADDLPVDPDVPETNPASARRRAHGVVRVRWDILLVIAAGGAIGSLARWAVTEVVHNHPWRVPWGTWLENVSGAFALGLLMVFVLDVWPPRRHVRPFLAVGVLGGYTTFSTYMLDTHALLVDGHVPAAFGYLFGTLVTGLVAVAAGMLLARLTLGALQSRHRRALPHERQPTGHAGSSDPPQASSRSNPGSHVDAGSDPSARRNR
jgi:CrcB protein